MIENKVLEALITATRMLGSTSTVVPYLRCSAGKVDHSANVYTRSVAIGPADPAFPLHRLTPDGDSR
jgi:hypothetical protein